MPTLMHAIGNEWAAPAAREARRPSQAHAPNRNRPALILAAIAWLLAPFGGLLALAGMFLVFPPVLFLWGCYLAFGYVQAAQARPGRPQGGWFWVASALTNGIFFVVTIGTMLAEARGMDAGDLALWIAVAGWQMAAVWLSAAAARHESVNRPPPQGGSDSLAT
jgi:hypothetical protein